MWFSSFVSSQPSADAGAETDRLCGTLLTASLSDQADAS